MDFTNLFHDAKDKATQELWSFTIQPEEYSTVQVIFDVRSPVEFEKSHIPGAINLPLFTNEERAQVGTVFKKEGKEAAVKLGLNFVESKIQDLGMQTLEHCEGGKSVAVCCARGRMRSSSVCFFISSILGATAAIFRVEGGHQAYRNWVIRYVPRISFVLLTGRTGSGKTYILYELEKLGEQVIDLEKEAGHRGSAFGLLGADRQLRSSQFQNNLVHRFSKLDPTRAVYLEHEHTRIGSCHLPGALATFLCEQPSCIFQIHKSTDSRVETILSEYAQFGPEKLSACLKKIQKKKFSGDLAHVENLINEGNLGEAVVPLLTYYDRLYDGGLAKRMKQVKNGCKANHLNFEDNSYESQAKKIRHDLKQVMARKDRGLSSALALLGVLICISLAYCLNRSGMFLDNIYIQHMPQIFGTIFAGLMLIVIKHKALQSYYTS